MTLTGLLVTALATAAPARAQTLEGRWLTQEKTGVVQIYGCVAGTLCGRLLWVRILPSDDNPRALDIHNPTPGLRNRPLCGLVIMSGFKPDGRNHWGGGSIYDPKSGKTYHANMILKPDGILDLRGYVGIPLFGRSEDWTRFTQPMPSCPTME